jgi:transcriptional regulator with XRE-family HTH domain
VAENVKRLREGLGWSLARLSQQLGDIGRPILSTGLHRLEQGRRRIDADDLVALAAALDVSPITLLMPFTANGTVELTDSLEAEALVAWDWMRAARPLVLPADDREESVHQAVRFQMRALPMGARAMPKLLTGFFADNEDRGEDLSPLNWDSHLDRREEASHGEHRETP